MKAEPVNIALSWGTLEGLHWPCPTADHPGTPILHTQAFTSGKVRIALHYFLPVVPQA